MSHRHMMFGGLLWCLGYCVNERNRPLRVSRLWVTLYHGVLHNTPTFNYTPHVRYITIVTNILRHELYQARRDESAIQSHPERQRRISNDGQ